MNDNFKGFALFSDLEDKDLQTYNRARILVNIAQDHLKKERINAKGAALILGYFQQVPEEDREAVKDKFAALMDESGFKLIPR